MKLKLLSVMMLAGLLYGCSSKREEQTQPLDVPGALDRSSLPIKEPARKTYSELDVRNATPPPRFDIKPPKDAPNVLIVLIDDMGFGTSGSFGGPVNMPAFDRLAQNGIRYNRFHTMALCAPSRTVLLTGYNHHSNNMVVIT